MEGELEELSKSSRGSSQSRVLLGSVVWRAVALKSVPRGGGVCVLLSCYMTAVSEVSTGTGVAR